MNIDEQGNRRLQREEENLVEIWGDAVTIRDLVKSMAICLATTFGGYFLVPDDSYKPLLFGLAGAVTGFVASSLVIKPKRKFTRKK